MSRIGRPQSEGELWQRARQLSGHRLGELAAQVGASTPSNLRRAKGWVGRLIEECLGAPGGNFAGPDFRDLGIELKTLPIDGRGRVKESTYLCKVVLSGEPCRWERSRARKKLARVLWIPVRSDAQIPVAQRQVGHPLLWSPDAEEEAVLRQDWRFFMDLIGRGLVDTISGHDGQALQIRPKASSAKSLTWTIDEQGEATMTLPRGFYLRPTFTAALFRRHLYEGKDR